MLITKETVFPFRSNRIYFSKLFLKDFKLENQLLKNGNFINGKWVKGDGSNSLKVYDKFNHSLLHEVPFVNSDQLEEVIKSAQSGFKEMRQWSAGDRAKRLEQLYFLLNENKNYFIDLIVQEAGKPRSYAMAEVDRSLSTLKAAISEATRLGGEYVPLDYDAGAGKTAFAKYFPLGVILCITPFNFPLNLLMHKIAPALAMGNSVIVKPPPQSPLCAIALASLIASLDFPDGAFNVVNCEIADAEKLVKDNRIAMVSFTGSDKVGWHLKEICGRKKITLELGGNAAVIVNEISHVANIAKTVATGAFLYAGQICISTQRILVQANIYEAFLAEFLKETNNLVCGDPQDLNTIVGPVIDKKSFDRVTSWVQEAIKNGAKSLTEIRVDEKNHLIKPVILTNTNKKMKVFSEEVFGPVVIIEKFNTFQEAIDLVNDSDYGLQVGVFTNQIDLMKQAHNKLEVGGIIINNTPGFRVDTMPYGGVKGSGFGREGLKYAMIEMSEPRLIVY